MKDMVLTIICVLVLFIAVLVFHGTIGVHVGWLPSQSDMLSED